MATIFGRTQESCPLFGQTQMLLRFSINQAPEIVQTTSLPGRLTQRLECYPHTVEVTGSNPVPPTLNAGLGRRTDILVRRGRRTGMSDLLPIHGR